MNKINFPITKLNYNQIDEYLKLIDDEIVYLDFVYHKEMISIRDFYIIYSYLLKKYPQIEFRLLNVPFCIFSFHDYYIDNPSSKNKIHTKECLNCKYRKVCGGFWKNQDLTSIHNVPDLPSEIVIEVTSKCNKDCGFCFNTFPKNSIKDPSKEEIKKIINQTSRLKIPFIRFTGGEPFCRKDIFELINYAKSKKLKVRLNSNSIFINESIIKKIENNIDYILISYNDIKETRTIKALKLLTNSKIPIVICGTIALPKNIDNLEDMHETLTGIKISGWEFYRPMIKKQLTQPQITKLTKKLLKLNLPIANAFPFCAGDMKKNSLINLGAKYDDGHSRLIFDPRGYFKPSYVIDINLGKDIQKAWNSKFMTDMRTLKLVPDYCKDCLYLKKCKGGSRFHANLINKRYNTPDPLMKFHLKHLVIKPTKKCPMKCIGCKDRQDLYKGIKETMTFNYWKKVIKESKLLGLEKLTISGGEPTLYPRLYDLIKYSKSLKIQTLLNTTGLKLNTEKVINSKLDGITFSLESLNPKTDDKIRNYNYVPQILAHIQTLKGKISININTIITRYNYKEIPQIKQFCKANKINLILSYPEYEHKNQKLSVQNITEFKKINPDIPLNNNYSKGIYEPKLCLKPSYFALILPNGDVHPCNIVEYSHSPVVGNVHKNSLKSIWNNKQYTNFRINKHPECKYCPCPLRKLIKYN